QKIISAAGVCSRRAAEKLITEGRVTVNGATAALGMSADEELDDIRVDGQSISVSEAKTYIMLNKPRGFVTTMSDEKGRRTVRDLIESAGERLYPVGRLDMDSEGLLICTNDGELANRLMHPRYEMKKTYETLVSGAPMESALPILRSALVIDGYTITPAEAEYIGSEDGKQLLAITISEGRNRQVRKMCEQASLQVHRLRRVSEGVLKLGELPVGKWRYLTENEISSLKIAVELQ
ncbi:MAG: rRNA pseudouridine synthase, partial [Oscillospiraceae bacterium]|nr:rRNA pseudouridine synthase [Oscillospiraceae bacterium]